MRHTGFFGSWMMAAWLAAAAAQAQEGTVSGTVKETLEGGRYTYVLLDTGKGQEWLASFHFPVKVGERVTAHGGTPMVKFASPTLNRTFDRILFCGDVQVGTNAVVAAGLPAGHPELGSAPNPAAVAPPMVTGEVLETMNVASYTYVKVKGDKETIWAAATHFEVKKGDRVSVPKGALMKDFESPALNRTFKEIYFVGKISKEGEIPEAAPAHGSPHGQPGPTAGVPAVKAGSIEKPAGALTVAELFTQRKELAGKKAQIRGKVVKFTADIMGRNWIHLADGTEADGQRDITVTSDAIVGVGDTVTAQGTVAVDQNFGPGYFYQVLIEKADVTAK